MREKERLEAKKDGWSDILKANSLHQIEPLLLSPSTSYKFLTSEKNSKSSILETERERCWGGKAQ